MVTSRQKPKSTILPWLTATLLLVCAAISSLVSVQLFNNNSFLANQPLIIRICQHIDCSILTKTDLETDLTQLETLNSLIYQRNTDGTFTVKLMLKNPAQFDQPLPVLVIDALDANKGTTHTQRVPSAHYANTDTIPAETTQAFKFNLTGIPFESNEYRINLVAN